MIAIRNQLPNPYEVCTPYKNPEKEQGPLTLRLCLLSRGPQFEDQP